MWFSVIASVFLWALRVLLYMGDDICVFVCVCVCKEYVGMGVGFVLLGLCGR